MLDSRWLGTETEDVISIIWMSKDDPSSREIADKLDKSLAVNIISTIAKRLAEETSENQSGSDPIVLGTKDGWGLTQYGRLLCTHYFETSGSIDWLHEAILKAEEQDNSRTQLVIDNITDLDLTGEAENNDWQNSHSDHRR